MRILLHIGTEKTGTTALQAWLHTNAAGLRAEGIAYAASLDRPNNRKISVYARDPDQWENGFALYGIGGAADHAAFAAQVAQALHAEMAEAKRAGCRWFVISNEQLHSRLTTPAMVERIGALLLPYRDATTVLGYLRPQAELLQSRLSLVLRTGRPITEAELRVGPRQAYFDYLALRERWQPHFPTVTLLGFRRRRDVVADVAARLGTDTVRHPHPGRENQGLDAATARLLNQINLATQARHDRPADFGLLVTGLEDGEPGGGAGGEPLRLSRTHVERINATFLQRNQALVAAVADPDALSLDDLQADPAAYPERGSVEDLLTATPEAAARLLDMVEGLNVALCLAQAREALARHQLALRTRDVAQATAWLRRSMQAHARALALDPGRTVREGADVARALGKPGSKLPPLGLS